MGLTWRLRLSYSIGHILNDLCASVWFTYTLVFFKFGIGIPTSMAGLLILVGQIVDGIMTPIIGLLSDRFSSQSSIPLLISSSSGSSALASSPTGTHNHVHNGSSNPHTHITNHKTNYMSTYSTDILHTNNSNIHSTFTQRFESLLKVFRPYGRKIWHLIGSILIISSFPLIFGPPLGSSNSSTVAKMIYYLPLVAVFQAGWAAVQITHLAIINELSIESSERTLLTSLRYLFTVLSNLLVYISTFLLLQHQHHSSNNNMHNKTIINVFNEEILPSRRLLYNKDEYIMLPMVMTSHPLSKCSNHSVSSPSVIDFGKDDIPAFQKLGFTIIGVGGLTVLIFHFGVRKKDFVNSVPTVTTVNEADVPIYESINGIRHPVYEITTWKDWLRLPLFWILGFYYMFVRLIVNVSQAYLTIYLLYSLRLPKITMALVPLTVYLSSIATTLVQKPVQDRISRETNSGVGLIFVTIFCILVNYPGNPPILHRIYIAAGILGIGCTIILITSLAMVSDLIAKNQRHGAFVYGYMSFTDKLANGIVIQIIELLWNECSSMTYYQNVESYGIGMFVICQFIFLCIYKWRKNVDSKHLNIIHPHI
ncbi:Major facilitator superfamily domain-containing protein 12 [Schistosoma japonicum]|nr:Major facilitator superfamily domain-containing protein 12 [Schistosoma japonicum]